MPRHASPRRPHTSTRRAAIAALCAAAVASSAGTPVATQAPPAQATVVAGTSGAWVTEGADRAGDVKAAPFLGREALWLKNGTQALRAALDMADGTIEFDVAPMDRCDFVALVFRRQSFASHENVYLRVRQSGRQMALQYAPRTNGSSTWQLYPEFTAPVDWPRNAWTHVRAEVRGSRLEVYVGDAQAPALQVARLRHDHAAGGVGIWARVNDAPGEWAAAISNVRVTPTPPAPRAPAPPPPPGFLARWEVSAPVVGVEAPVRAIPDATGWAPVVAEDAGLVNLSRVFRAQRGRRTVLARTTLTSPAERLVLAGIGYSDDVTVFVNGRPVYTGVNGWESRGPGYASFVDARFESAWLPLRAGVNEIVLAITDDQLFGWGFAVRIDPLDESLVTASR